MPKADYTMEFAEAFDIPPTTAYRWSALRTRLDELEGRNGEVLIVRFPDKEGDELERATILCRQSISNWATTNDRKERLVARTAILPEDGNAVVVWLLGKDEG